MNYYTEVIRKYTQFTGRARRAEYWTFTLVNVCIGILLAIVEASLGILPEGGNGPLSALYTLFIFIPSLAVAVRRLHDTNNSGWYLLIAFIPIIGVIWLIILMLSEGDNEENQYGPDPKAQQEIY